VVQAKVIEGIASLQVIVVMDPVTKKPMLQMHRKLEGFQKISPEVLKTLPDDHPAKSAPQSHLDAPDQPGYQFLQARALVLIDNPVLGLVACMPIGMAQISSVVLSVDAGNYLTKGQEMSFFKFGGSDIVMVFQEKAKVQFTAKYNQWNPFGKQIAISGADVSQS
jgi:phosphatidylserine decarboxylase